MFSQLSCRQRTRATVTHVAWLKSRMFACFRHTDQIEIVTLGRVEHRVLKVGIGFVPILRFQKRLNCRILEDPTVATKYNSTHERQVFELETRYVGGFQ